ncbi:hypothetical protein ACWHAM_20265 [Paenibacillus terrae]
MGWYINADFEEGTVIYRSCICGDVARITVGVHEKFEYFRVGHKSPTVNSYRCKRITARGQSKCVHEWIILGSDINYQGDRNILKMKDSPALEILGLDNSDIEHLAYGSTRYWCHECGCFYDLSPQKQYLLPKQGYIYD